MRSVFVFSALTTALAFGAVPQAGCIGTPGVYTEVAVGPPAPPADGIYFSYREGYVWVEGRWEKRGPAVRDHRAPQPRPRPRPQPRPNERVPSRRGT